MKRPPQRRAFAGRAGRAGRAGFSLFEIAVAMAILGLISGAIFSILWQAGDTAVEIRELDRRDEEVSRFLALLRESIEHLPQGGTLEMVPAEESVSGHPELKIGNSATAFVFGKVVGSAEETVLSLRPGRPTPEGAPTYDLAITRPDFVPEDTGGSGMALRAGADDFLQADEEGRYWMPLLGGVTSAGWSYWDEEQQLWLDEWTDDSRLPPLLAFSFDDAYRPVPLRVVFEVPEQVSNPPAEANAAAGSPAGASTATGGSGGGRNAGGPDRPGGDGRPGGGGGRPGGGEGRPGRGGGGGAGGGGGPGGSPAPGGGGGSNSGGGGGAR